MTNTAIRAAIGVVVVFSVSVGPVAASAAGGTTNSNHPGASSSDAIPAPSSAPGTAGGGGGGQDTCTKILGDGPKVAGQSPSILCPAIKALGELFDKPTDNYAKSIQYSTTKPEAFAEALTSSLSYYGKHGVETINLGFTGNEKVTLESLDRLDEANGYKRPKLGLILERIRSSNGGKAKPPGQVCVQREVKTLGESFFEWAGSKLLQYGLPALIRLFKGDPAKVIDKYDALVTVSGGGQNLSELPIVTVSFRKRGTLPAACKAL